MTLYNSSAGAWGVRLLVAAVFGALGYFGADVAAQQIWHTHPELWAQVTAGLVPAAIALYASKSLATFTDSCLICQTPGTMNLKGDGRECSKANCKHRARPVAADSAAEPAAEPAQSKTTPNEVPPQVSIEPKATRPTLKPASAAEKAKATATATSVAQQFGTLVSIEKKLHIDTEAPGEDGFVTITVTTFPTITNKQLKILIGRLGNVTDVRWSKHKGLGDGRKQIVGKVLADKSVETFAQLVELVERYR